jgi:thiol-disulfide isomerase/thioredoxin
LRLQDGGRSALRGKVVLIDFWTYTCINWRRTLPYVRAWAEKYADKGLVVVGVHTPEFSFEKNVDNVRWATKEMRIDFPVSVDSDYRIWHAFNNQYWPALYFIDAMGRIRHRQFGEGEYERSEMIIKRLLAENGAVGIDDEPVSVDALGLEVPADWRSLRSPESYLGFEQAADFASPGGGRIGQASHLPIARQIAPQRVGTCGRLDDNEECRGNEHAEWTHRLSVPRPRCASRHGPTSAGSRR